MNKIVIEKNSSKIFPIDKVEGEITVCADKSITHRAIMLTAITKGTSKIKNYLSADDCSRTISCLRELGVQIREDKKDLIVCGNGREGLSQPKKILDAGNSGTTIRLLSGILSGCPFLTEITGDDSLKRRPMHRIIEPLTMMGAEISSSRIIPPISMSPGETITQVLYPDKYPPLKIKGRYPLKPISYNLPIASAQVKSAILLAGLFADGETTIFEPLPSRDHTERMLIFFGVSLKKEGNQVVLSGTVNLEARDLEIAGDFSAASFFLVLALLLPNSRIKINNVGINPTRIGFLEVVRKMGGKIILLNQREISGEPVADILVETSKLRNVSLKKEEIPMMIDEIPLFTLLATQAEGVSEISGAEELRHKESDRIETISSQLNLLGAKIKTKPDGMIIEGPTKLKGARVKSFADHRIAMTLVIAGLIAQGETTVGSVDCIKISFPDFWKILNELKQ
ncbi:MAG TPA: 3-phosphoshikimate 1-carboxyvinyltransferase [Elusimicrobia bacterium]|jgi:3-phosphoshikimate 1-carboxyvinyltransferase|nr:3-phosphoshikimate 1-carboxyvinyltransferase [Elusimicrobiota bacterium]